MLNYGNPLRRWQLHDASELVAAQLGVSRVDALVRLCARAFAEDATLTDVAGDIVAGRRTIDG